MGNDQVRNAVDGKMGGKIVSCLLWCMAWEGWKAIREGMGRVKMLDNRIFAVLIKL